MTENKKQSKPLSTELSNSAGIDNVFTCPACYKDHNGHLHGKIIDCSCGHKFTCELIMEPVCHTRLITSKEKEE